jgi:hypothetical protein
MAAPRSLRATFGVVLAVGGMVTLCLGLKAPAILLFGVGLGSIEWDWRARHPEFRGSIAERFERSLTFYRATHRDRTNRTLHVIGIPLIVLGAVGLFAAAPVHSAAGVGWGVSLLAFAIGWLLNIVGHAAYEKRAPAFSEDCLSFLAGPVWDLQQLFRPAASRSE